MRICRDVGVGGRSIHTAMSGDEQNAMPGNAAMSAAHATALCFV
jgi:hypothetical protein